MELLISILFALFLYFVFIYPIVVIAKKGTEKLFDD